MMKGREACCNYDAWGGWNGKNSIALDAEHGPDRVCEMKIITSI